MKSCPHCSASIHKEASFCPHCARSVNDRREIHPPRRLPGRALQSALMVLLVLAAVLTAWLYTRPKVYDNGTAEVIYTDSGGSYQLLLNYFGDRFQPMTDYSEELEEGTTANKPSRLFVNHVDTGVNAKEAFLRKVEDITVELLQGSDGPEPWQYTPPQVYDFAPEAARASILTYTGHSGDMELRWTIRMQNGDTIHLYQRMVLGVVPTRHFYPEDAPMDTMEDLQFLVDEVNETIPANIIVYLHLPALTYEGSLVLEGRSMNLVGSESPDGSRTTFTDTLQATAQKGYICQFNGIDFVGGGEGVGVSASARINFTDCRLSGWRTGVLCYGDSWVNAKNCVFENNAVGFHFNSVSDNPNDHMYSGNLFQGNETAVLLESVPSDQALYFDGTRFSRNSTDIDNRCGHEVSIANAIFE
ncbi:zinc ribbon domain-containing protein [Pseudoflavonifractor sp. 60]|uniref:zinc ribbon domain-containing protein n=1 Tax=Pseudoflavonifractor sp. 60 TaxID=2304576 RepID=UPI0013709ADC|nr:zinc ribbon domain-containing protein [Pseudoflavonifractor sp. 60]NBI68320.1 zinc ribbon domain-containing protein [Pseudoflavonifractor sp. 60]